jgi:hypothetical protein
MEGKGVQVMSDGSTYEGDYWDGKPHGAGKRIFRSGAVYDGEFRCASCVQSHLQNHAICVVIFIFI